MKIGFVRKTKKILTVLMGTGNVFCTGWLTSHALFFSLQKIATSSPGLLGFLLLSTFFWGFRLATLVSEAFQKDICYIILINSNYFYIFCSTKLLLSNYSKKKKENNQNSKRFLISCVLNIHKLYFQEFFERLLMDANQTTGYVYIRHLIEPIAKPWKVDECFRKETNLFTKLFI